ncbi:DMT family transporter [Polycladomyces subterraneus]|uniref:DMT family transporter n=1 Tax=Polycladomyces subterraneus TaxID=1016997 RepID=A0ABT8IQ79_9BACL|nr:DMT family transporter [Polycladomyces subterraneus]MDN4594868.1 DMT family transporter [Polycladomyces subterraneus]
MRINRSIASLFVLTAAASYGLLSPLVKMAYADGLHPTDLTAAQAVAGALGIWIVCLAATRQVPKLSARTVLALCGCGAMGGLTGVFYFTSLQDLPASFAILLLFQFTWMGMVLEWRITRRAPSRNQRWALALILAGTVLAAGWTDTLPSTISIFGVTMALLSAICYTGYIHLSGHIAVDVSPWWRSAWISTGSVVVTLLVFPPRFLWDGAWQSSLWEWAGWIALFGTILPSILFTAGVTRIGTGLASTLGSLELPVAVSLSAWWLGEPVTPAQWMGVLLILAGILMAEVKLNVHKEKSWL